MTGLLQRLAARAAGTAWTVRTDVRLPFGGGGLEPVQDMAPPPMDAALRERSADLQARAAPAPAAPATPHPTPPAAARTVAPHAGRTQPAPATAATTEPAPLLPSRQPETPRAAALPETVAAAVPAPPSERASAAPSARSPAFASTPSPARPAPAPVLHGEGPAPLLPPRPRSASHAAPATPGTMPFALRPAQATATTHEPEVHIHIGRIDVTALQEAPRPKARPRERAQPVSLDAYLAARSKSS